MPNWKIQIERVEVVLPVGIFPHEKTPQRIWVDAEVELPFAGEPESIDDCFNYEIVYAHVTKTWPMRGHTDLLETLVIDLLKHIFASDARVTWARVGVAKPDGLPNTTRSQVALAWDRKDVC